MDRIWVMVANSARARLYERDPDTAELLETRDFVHPQSRQRAAQLMHDRSGHTEHGLGTAGRGSAQYEPARNPRQRERAKFAHELAQFLELAALDRRCPGWVLFASDPFLGELRGQLRHAARSVLIAAEPRDLTALDPRRLARRVIGVLEAQF